MGRQHSILQGDRSGVLPMPTPGPMPCARPVPAPRMVVVGFHYGHLGEGATQALASRLQ